MSSYNILLGINFERSKEYQTFLEHLRFRDSFKALFNPILFDVSCKYNKFTHYNIPGFLCLLIHKVTGAISAGGWHPVARERANFSFKILRDDWLHFVLKINNLSDVFTLRNPCESLT